MKVSDCCGAPPRSNGDCDTSDYGICPDCGEHCEYVEEEETENNATMNEYYDVKQGGYDSHGKYHEPYQTSEITDERMLEMMGWGIAKPCRHDTYPGWGHGVYERGEDGKYKCIAHNWDSSD